MNERGGQERRHGVGSETRGVKWKKINEENNDKSGERNDM